MDPPNKEIHLPGLCAFVGELIQRTRIAFLVDINPFITNPAHEEVFHTTGVYTPYYLWTAVWRTVKEL